MPKFTELSQLYITPAVPTDDYNIVKGIAYPAPNCGAMPCNIHRGDPKAAYEVSAMGHMPLQASYGYFHPAYAPWLQSGRSVLMTATGESYRIMNIPSFRSRFAQTAHVKCLLNLYLVGPQGIPKIYHEVTFAYGRGSASGIDTL